MKRLLLLTLLCLLLFTTHAQVLTALDLTHWDYTKEKDEMAGAMAEVCMISSYEHLMLSTGDADCANLGIKRVGDILTISLFTGHGDVANSGNKYVNIKFDNTPTEAFAYTYATPGRLSFIDFVEPGYLLFRIRRSRTMLIQANFYNDGGRIMKFNIANLPLPLP